MAAGVTQPGGAGTKICIYDDASSASGTGYTMAEISAAFPAVIVDLGTNRKSYRCIQDIQIGDTTTNAATTTLVGTNVDIYFDSGKILRTRTTQLTSWYLRLGTKVGTGNQASGKDGCTLVMGAAAANWPLQSFVYGGTLRQTAGAFIQSSTNNVSEYCNVILQSSASGTTPISPGASAAAFSNLYNVDISHVTTAQVASNFFGTNAERITIACAAPTAFISSGAAAMSIKDVAFFGSPTQSDLRWSSGAGLNWVLVRPKWTGNAAKFSAAATINLSGAALEYWLYDVKCVDGAGAGVSGIPVRLTDSIGNVQVDTTTDANGAISFGSGLTANAVAVMDHYAPSSVYTQRSRSPFLVEINTGVGSNPLYESKSYSFNWPGSEAVTTSSGSFGDVTDVIKLGPSAQVYTSDIPLDAAGVERIQVPIGTTT